MIIVKWVGRVVKGEKYPAALFGWPGSVFVVCDHVHDELLARDKASLDVFWLRDESLEDSAGLPAPDVLAAEIVEDLQAALEQFREIAEELGNGGTAG